MAHTLDVILLPGLVPPDALAGRAVIVIDVLRATTTIATALAAGAHEILPVAEIETALRLAAQPRQRPTVLGGERGGRTIAGFDLGNSPNEYTPASVGGRTIVFTTTNGTRALEHARQGARVSCAAFVNAAAVVRSALDEEHLVLLCAGTDGQITNEDVLLAGCLACRLAAARDSWHPDQARWNDQARLAADAWRELAGDSSDVATWPVSAPDIARLAAALRDSAGGRNLLELGLDRDIDDAAQADCVNIVPQLDVAAWRVVASALRSTG
ncbi:MAG: 2-phosphosulfolactate phosphatase [Pirellulales bacterium]|nr:2-phosphosulfolactate phosphatase [Pirellulales bacterium]